MTLTTIALQNLRRRKGRTLFLLLTFCLITSIIIGLQALSSDMRDDLQKSLTNYGANLVITPRSEHFSLSYSGISIPGVSYNIKPLNNDVLTTIKQASGIGIQAIAPTVIGKVQGPNKPLLIVGVDFSTELKLKPWWEIVGSNPGPDQIVVGANIAQQYNLTTGSTFLINRKSYPVSGVMQETGGSEDQVIFSDIGIARYLTGNLNSWTMIELNSQQPDLALAQLTHLLPNAKVAEISQLLQGSKETIDQFNNFALFASLILILIGILIAAVSVSANINSRISEIGVFRAIGFRQSHIFKLLFWEIAILSISGSFIGYLIGITVPLIVGPFLLKKVLAFHMFPLFAVFTVSTSLLAATISIILPAWRAMRLDPIESLHSF